MKASSAIFATFILSYAPLVHAQDGNTIPVGSVTTKILEGRPTGRSISVISFPLNGSSTASGLLRGTITGVTANSLANTAAGWQPAELSAAATPHIIRITSGAAKGRSFLISTSTANTATTVTIDSEEALLIDLRTSGIAAGDSYEILACDTLSSVLGTPTTTGILGGPNADAADIVQILVQGQYRKYYYNTTRSAWIRVGLESVSPNVALRPDTALIYSRLGQTPLELTILGRVPTTERKSLVANTGPTLLANGWPVATTLATSGISDLAGWVKNSSANVADSVQVNINGTWLKYYHDGTQWRRVGTNTPSNNVVLGVADGVLIGKQGNQAGASTLNQNLPYNL